MGKSLASQLFCFGPTEGFGYSCIELLQIIGCSVSPPRHNWISASFYISKCETRWTFIFVQVLESHVIPSKAFHSNILETFNIQNQFISAMQGKIRAYRLNGVRGYFRFVFPAAITKITNTSFAVLAGFRISVRARNWYC